MNAPEKSAMTSTFVHQSLYGAAITQPEGFSGAVPADFTLNSPVGVCMDHFNRVWVCDTGNNRIVVLDQTLDHIFHILHHADSGYPTGTQVDARPGANRLFRMPFHVCNHPEKNRVYITDMGNSRIVAMDYDADGVHFAFEFGNLADDGFDPLQDPNGIALVKRHGGYFVHVNDEFFHTDTENTRNRCVCFDDEGRYQSEFRTVVDANGKGHDLFWPQSLSADAEGNLYIANTGSYQVLKCSSHQAPDGNLAVPGSVLVAAHERLSDGVGLFNIMRYVNVVDGHVYIPNRRANTVSVLDLEGNQVSELSRIQNNFVSQNEEVDSPADVIYYALGRAALLNPYVICQTTQEDVFLVSEPFISRIKLVRITNLDQPVATVQLLDGLGGRRDNPSTGQAYPQFNCVTSVAGLVQPARLPSSSGQDVSAQGMKANVTLPPTTADDLPPDVRSNPLQRWWMEVSQFWANQYAFWATPVLNPVRQASPFALLNLDAGNWMIQTYTGTPERMTPVPTPMHAVFTPGNLAMTTYHPVAPLLGQVCPGTPIVFVVNFVTCTVSMYQQGPFGNLLHYGLPFGHKGSKRGCLKGPQGIAVSPAGDIYIADTQNHRISKWRLLPTGQVVFSCEFSCGIHGREPDEEYIFTPSDVAIDLDGRVLVTDQFNDRICVFDRDGNMLFDYGDAGYWTEGQDIPPMAQHPFRLPTSLCVDGEYLIVNDLVNRALKLFRIQTDTLEFCGGTSLFKLPVSQGGAWMPFFMFAQDRHVYVADATYNVVQVYAYAAPT